MKIGNRHLGGMLATVLLSVFSGSVGGQVNVTTFHNDNSRTGQNIQETILTPANVNSSTFGKVFTRAVDGLVYAQPLYLANVAIAGGTHNVLYVATEHDSLYAIDADSGAVYWQVSLIASGGTTVSSNNDIHCTDLVPEVGITGTPVIDTTTGTIYLVSRSNVGGTLYQYLHALDVATAAEKFGGPVSIQASASGAATDGNGTTVPFSPKMQNQRAGLLLENGHVVIGWASHCDNTPWHGWVMAYSAANLSQEAVYLTSPNGYGDGVWMSAGGIAADASGDIYFATGNGSWNGTTDLGDSIVKLGPPSGGRFPVVDYFTPYNQQSLAQNDLDVASGGVTLLPALPSGQQLLVAQAKEGKIFLVDQNNMGKYCPNLTPACTTTDTNIVQEVPNVSVGVWGVPAYWNGYVYWGPANGNTSTPDSIKAFTFNAGGSGLVSTSAVSKSAATFNYGAPVPSISANGTTNGILWGVDNETYQFTCTSSTDTDCQTLYAYDATNLANMLYNSNQAANFRDVPPGGGAVKYITPIIANGKVYFGGQASVSAYGLLTPPAATPAFSPAAGNYPSAQTVSLSDSTSGALIYYTLDGTTPTTSSAKYSTALTVSATTTVKAIATASGFSTSAVASATYTIGTQSPAATPTFSPAAGSYPSAQTVSLADSTPGALIYYTLDGTTPTTSSTKYSTALTVSATTTIKALAAASGFSNSAVASATYTISAPSPAATPTFSPAAGSYTAAQTVSISDSTSGAVIYYTLDGTTPTTNSAKYSTALTVSATTTIKALATASGYANSAVGSATYTISAATTVINDPSGFSSTAGLSLVGGAALSGTALQVTDGGAIEARAAWWATPVNVQSFTTDFYFQDTSATADGFTFTLQNTGVSAVGGVGGALGYQGIGSSAAVKFDLYNNSGEGPDSTGFYTNGASPTVPSVDMSASGVNLHSGDIMHAHLTYDGTTLTLLLTDTVTSASFTTSTAINIPSTVGANTAYAGFTGGTGYSSAVQSILSWTYTSGSLAAAATPTFSPAAGSYTSAQTVNLADSTTGAAIYYTTDGTTPTTSSAKYSTALTVSATTTIKALAVASGYSNSAVASATYTISVPSPAATPTFSPAAGSYSATQTVSISDSTSGAVIYYTLDGTTPTTSSAKYSTALTVSATTTIKALATASGYSNSAVTSATYTINTVSTAATPTFSPAAGNYTATQSVSLSDSTTGAVIYYTLDGTTPTTTSAKYSTALTVSTTTTIKALATASGYSNSAVASATYTISTASVINDPSGFSSTAGLSLVGGTALSGTALQITDGGAIEARAAWWATPVNVQSFTTDFYFQDTSATADGFTFTLQNTGVSAVGGVGGALGYQGIGSSVAVKFDLYDNSGEGPDSTGFYTNGASPTVPSVDMSASGVNLHSGDMMHAHLTYDGTTLTLLLTDSVTSASFTTSAVINIPSTVGANTAYVGFTGGTGYSSAVQSILSWTYNSGAPTAAATPAFSPVAGSYPSAQTVSLADSTTGAAIYYTTDGTTPTTSSAKYSTALTVSATTTIKALAVASGYSNSAVASATYTISVPSPAATPTFSPAAGSYTAAQTVSISDSTSGAVIYYTLDGTTPTTSSTKYSTVLTVSATTTVKALATASGFSNSAVASATYTISAPSPAATPTFSPAAGNYTATQTVSISDSTSGAVIYYTLDGTTPTTSSTKYSTALTVSATTTIKALATASGYSNSAVASATYTISGATTVINDPSGFSSTAGLSLVGGTALSGTALQITDGGAIEARAAWWATPVNVQSFTTDFYFQDTSATADGFTFTLQNTGVSAVGGVGGALGYQGIGSSVAVKFDLYDNSGEGPDSTGFYTNGASPTVPSVDMSASGVNLHSGDMMHAHLTYDGTTLTLLLTDSVTSASFTTSAVINIPSTVGANTAYVGFTGGTGYSSAVQSILSWTYTH